MHVDATMSKTCSDRSMSQTCVHMFSLNCIEQTRAQLLTGGGCGSGVVWWARGWAKPPIPGHHGLVHQCGCMVSLTELAAVATRLCNVAPSQFAEADHAIAVEIPDYARIHGCGHVFHVGCLDFRQARRYGPACHGPTNGRPICLEFAHPAQDEFVEWPQCGHRMHQMCAAAFLRAGSRNACSVCRAPASDDWWERTLLAARRLGPVEWDRVSAKPPLRRPRFSIP